ncbi:hypothetical protein DL771_005477 [Monosporascus sp. 5C6A]|nr:hypothetical protein DL771_005477 [Monosporascus sp. 5C6A]
MFFCKRLRRAKQLSTLLLTGPFPLRLTIQDNLLSAFTSLRHLTIHTVCLLGLRLYDMEPLEKNLGPLHLIDVLPRSLEKLVLIEKWCGHRIRLQKPDPNYLVWWAEEHLWQFARQCRLRHAALQSTVFRASRQDTDDYYDSFPDYDTAGEELAAVRALVRSLPDVM